MIIDKDGQTIEECAGDYADYDWREELE